MLILEKSVRNFYPERLSRNLPLVVGEQRNPTIIQIGDVKIGHGFKTVIAGPCTLESLEHTLSLGRRLKRSGISIFRGSVFKNRTSPYSFQGHGFEALSWHKEVKKQFNLLIETEITDAKQIETVADCVDIIRVGARNMHNSVLLQELGKIKKPIILKRSFGATIEEWLSAAEYLMYHGNEEIILCERGIRTFEPSTRFSLDFCGLARVLEITHLPVIIDPSHAAGSSSLVLPLAKAALALGVHGLLIEVHDKPEAALCDGFQAITPDVLDLVISEIN
ncbi:MAG: 3-deoxy-7-phosphoheptulonate synthase [Victivallaceae bacterium]